MTKKGIKKQFWCSAEEALELQKKAFKVGITEAEVIRRLIMNKPIKEKPDNRFYEEMKQLRIISNNLNQLVMKAHATNYINTSKLEKEYIAWQKFIKEIKNEFLMLESRNN